MGKYLMAIAALVFLVTTKAWALPNDTTMIIVKNDTDNYYSLNYYSNLIGTVWAHSQAPFTWEQAQAACPGGECSIDFNTNGYGVVLGALTVIWQDKQIVSFQQMNEDGVCTQLSGNTMHIFNGTGCYKSKA